MTDTYPVTVRVTKADGTIKEFGFESIKATRTMTTVWIPRDYPGATFEIIENTVPANYTPTTYL